MLIGFGDVALRVLPTLIGSADVTGVSRRPETLPDSLTHRIFGDYTQPASLLEAVQTPNPKPQTLNPKP